MIEQTEALCDLWDEERVEMKSHSRLYHLDPIGVGSPMVESLTSYITRLAEAHSVSTYTLFRREIGPELKQAGGRVDGTFRDVWPNSPILNGLTTVTQRLVQALSHLTGCRVLSNLTMLAWKPVLSTRLLMRRRRAWCPRCYAEWQKAGQVIYEPLLWALETMKICSKHAVVLQQHCPNPECARTAFPLTPWSQSGFCPRCHRWLGGIPRDKTSCREEEWQEQQRVNYQIGELLAAATELAPLPQDRFTHVINACVEAVTEGNATEFARRLDLEQAEVWRWQRRGTLPQLETLLWICARLTISPLQFLTGDLVTILPYQRSRQKYASRPKKSMGRLKQVDREHVKEALEAIIQMNEVPPPSMHEVARRIGHARETLYALFPECCRTIGQRYRKYRNEQREKRIQRICDEVRETAYRLYAQGRYPDEGAVKKMLTTRGAFKMREVQQAWKNILRELDSGAKQSFLPLDDGNEVHLPQTNYG
jgi:transcriptional regulator with XRE-family HTH domain